MTALHAPKKTPESIQSIQVDMEQLFAKNQLIPRIKTEFIERGVEEFLASKDIQPMAAAFDLMVQMVLHLQAPVQVMAGILRHHFEAEEHPLQAAADFILKAVDLDLVDVFLKRWEDEITGEQRIAHILRIRFDISAQVRRELDQFQFPLPMVVEPNPIQHNRQTGYLTLKGSVLLKDNHHEDDVCLDHLNRMNRIPLQLNADVVAFVQNRWKDLDKQREDETWVEFKKRREAFAKYDLNSRDILAALMAANDRFWLTHRYDKRGRTYCQGYHVTYQGNDWCKAVVQFAEGERLNDGQDLIEISA